MLSLHLLSVAALPATILAATIDINVGQSGLAFSPDNVKANKGDVLNFHFFPPEHSVAESTFAQPCQPSTGGIYSGILTQSGESSQVFQVTVNDTNPIWLYCSVPTHCESGMAMVVNQPSTGNTLSAYQSAAKSANSVSPPGLAGGVLVAAAQASGGSSSSASSPSSTSSSAAGGGGGGAYGGGAASTSSSTPAKTGGAAGNDGGVGGLGVMIGVVVVVVGAAVGVGGLA